MNRGIASSQRSERALCGPHFKGAPHLRKIYKL